MPGDLIRCPHCNQVNRVPAAAAGTPRCGKCHQPLPWIADADDTTFAEVADAAKVPVIVDLWAPWCGPCPLLKRRADHTAGPAPGRPEIDDDGHLGRVRDLSEGGVVGVGDPGQ